MQYKTLTPFFLRGFREPRRTALPFKPRSGPAPLPATPEWGSPKRTRLSGHSFLRWRTYLDPNHQAEAGKYLLSILLPVRSRAVVGVEQRCAGAHWDEYTGRQRLTEVLSRMEVGGGKERAALEAALLQPGGAKSSSGAGP